jgi:hypothetical protein
MSKEMNEMIIRKEWSEFRKTGLLLFINQILHIFGWAIVCDIDDNNQINIVYPARVKFRGFDTVNISESYKNITSYMYKNINDLFEEANL